MQFCSRGAEQKYGTPPGLLDAIARAESGRRIAGATTLQPWPWALNVDGRGLYFATREQAIARTRKALEQGSNATDVGCMQVDLQFHPKAFRTLEDAYDPETNADYAARFLVSLYESMGANWFVAAGLYHSRSPDLARLYRDQITAVSAGLPARAEQTSPSAVGREGHRNQYPTAAVAPPPTTHGLPSCYHPWPLSSILGSGRGVRYIWCREGRGPIEFGRCIPRR